MQSTVLSRADDLGAASAASHGRSAASWGAIVAGAFVAVSASLILLSLGAGFEFAAISPWAGHGISATTFTVTSAIWFIVTQWISACLGGYIAGRLRTRWMGTHTHEVFFRDTAHGLITWAVATILVATVVAGSFMSAAGGAGRAVADAGAAPANSPVSAYEVDKLFRTTNSGGSASLADARMETAHIVANAFVSGSVSDADRTYLTEQVAARTGATQAGAQARVDGFLATVTQAQAKLEAEADSARKAAAEASLYLALSLLTGAFIA